MRPSDLGPTWYDCTLATDELIHKYGKAVSYGLVPAIRRFDGRGYSTWTAVARVNPRLGQQGREIVASAPFGKGGAHKTAPAALHAALLDIIAQLDAQQAVAEQQAAF